jgi:urease accessory protein
MISKVNIRAGLREGSTYLRSSYADTPLKIANITEDKSAHVLELMMMSSSPGILDGDCYEIDIDVEKGGAVKLTTQSFQRLYSMKKSAAQKMKITLGEDASFCYLPHPTVPHKDSDFVATNNIYLKQGCSLTWGEILTCGRRLNNEAFNFTRFQSVTKIYLADRLVVKENLLVHPYTIDVSSIGQLEGFTHQASLIYVDETSDSKCLVQSIHELLLSEENICFGVTSLPVNGLIVRVLGYKAEQLFEIVKTIATGIADLATKRLKDTPSEPLIDSYAV